MLTKDKRRHCSSEQANNKHNIDKKHGAPPLKSIRAGRFGPVVGRLNNMISSGIDCRVFNTTWWSFEDGDNKNKNSRRVSGRVVNFVIKKCKLENVNPLMKQFVALKHANLECIFAMLKISNDTLLFFSKQLDHTLDMYSPQNGDLPPMLLLADVLYGLQYMHAHMHIAHCDLKPNNIMISSENRAVIIDFNNSRAECEFGTKPLPQLPAYRHVNLLFQPLHWNYCVDTWGAAATLYEVVNKEKTKFYNKLIGFTGVNSKLAYLDSVPPEIAMRLLRGSGQIIEQMEAPSSSTFEKALALCFKAHRVDDNLIQMCLFQTIKK